MVMWMKRTLKSLMASAALGVTLLAQPKPVAAEKRVVTETLVTHTAEQSTADSYAYWTTPKQILGLKFGANTEKPEQLSFGIGRRFGNVGSLEFSLQTRDGTDTAKLTAERRFAHGRVGAVYAKDSAGKELRIGYGITEFSHTTTAVSFSDLAGVDRMNGYVALHFADWAIGAGTAGLDTSRSFLGGRFTGLGTYSGNAIAQFGNGEVQAGNVFLFRRTKPFPIKGFYDPDSGATALTSNYRGATSMINAVDMFIPHPARVEELLEDRGDHGVRLSWVRGGRAALEGTWKPTPRTDLTLSYLHNLSADGIGARVGITLPKRHWKFDVGTEYFPDAHQTNLSTRIGYQRTF